MSRALPQYVSASEIANHFGMTQRYWTKMASEGKVPGAWQPSGEKGKWLFDLQAVRQWQRNALKQVNAWPGYTSAERRTGAAPNVPGRNIASPSAPRIA